MLYLSSMDKLNDLMYESIRIIDLNRNGIYKLYHINKPLIFYIGSASGTYKGLKYQAGFYRRFYQHVRDLERNLHSSKYLQNVVNKYGIEGIRFEIIEFIESKDRIFILEREQYYLDTLKPVYNTSKLARCCVIPYTPERLKAASERMKGKALPESVYEQLRKPVFQFTKDGIFINTYPSIKHAARLNKIDFASINKAACGKRETAGGFIWSFAMNVKIPIKTKVYQYTLNDLLINTYDTVKQARLALHLTSDTAIHNCFTGKQKQAYGFKWIRK